MYHKILVKIKIWFFNVVLKISHFYRNLDFWIYRNDSNFIIIYFLSLEIIFDVLTWKINLKLEKVVKIKFKFLVVDLVNINFWNLKNKYLVKRRGMGFLILCFLNTHFLFLILNLWVSTMKWKIDENNLIFKNNFCFCFILNYFIFTWSSPILKSKRQNVLLDSKSWWAPFYYNVHLYF